MALIHCDFRSEVLQLCCSMCVVIPQRHGTLKIRESGRTTKYPTLYLLHGLSDDHTIWHRRTSIERYAEALGLAVVMPAAHRSFYADMACGSRYWTHISEEVPVVARALFPLSGARSDNFVAGLSMGGYGAFKMGLTCHDRFAAAASLSGALDVARIARDEVLRQAEMKSVFGDLTRLAGGPDDLFQLAKKVARRGKRTPLLYQCCGTGDELYADNVRFRDHALSLGLPLTYEEGPGEHEWGYWDRQIQKVLQWLPIRRKE